MWRSVGAGRSESHAGGRWETIIGGEAGGAGSSKRSSTGTITGAKNLRKRLELGLTAKTFRQRGGGFAATLSRQEERWKTIQIIRVVQETRQVTQGKKMHTRGVDAVAPQTITEIRYSGAFAEANRAPLERVVTEPLKIGGRIHGPRGRGLEETLRGC